MELNNATLTFMEGPVPNLTRAIEKLTKKLDDAFMVDKAGPELDAAIADLEEEDKEEALRAHVLESVKGWIVSYGVKEMVPLNKAILALEGVFEVLGIESEKAAGRISEDEAAAQGDSQIQ